MFNRMYEIYSIEIPSENLNNTFLTDLSSSINLIGPQQSRQIQNIDSYLLLYITLCTLHGDQTKYFDASTINSNPPF